MPATGIKDNSEPIQLTFRASVHLGQRMPVRAPEPAPTEAQPSTGKARRQQRDAVPYPLNYDRRVLDFDVWDHDFSQQLRGSITLHDFGNTPPKRSLDLGCGTGMFILKAAQEWPDCEFVGFDITNIQPNLDFLDPSIASRIQWVQGNVLEELPFPSNHFDHVRICRLAMGIPENRWSDVIEEAVRVMKPGSAFEMLEDDIIFPFAQPPPLPQQEIPIAPPKRSTPPDTSDTSLKSPKPFIYESASGLRDVRDVRDVRDLRLVTSTRDIRPNVRDHGILKSAFEAMLSDRFINPNPSSILPYYLSLYLKDVESQTPLQIIIPPRSKYRPAPGKTCSHHSRARSIAEEPSMITPDSNDSNGIRLDMTRAPVTKSQSSKRKSNLYIDEASVATAAPMHLARGLAIVLGCKTALYRQFRKSNPKLRRGDFEGLLSDYMLDMDDRINMRTAMSESLNWTTPEPAVSEEMNDWLTQVARAEKRKGSQAQAQERSPSLDFPEYEPPPTEICRSFRGFIGWKAIDLEDA